MNQKRLLFTNEQIETIAAKHPTPFHIYDEKGIRETARDLLHHLAWNPGFREFFAVKATPNPFILKILKEEGFGMDCSSLPELLLAERVGVVGADIMFSSNDTPAREFIKASELNATINLDDISHIAFLERQCGLPYLISIRYNPGSSREGSFVMGKPEEAKYGFTRDQVFQGLDLLRSKGVSRFGLHTFIASNELSPQYFVDTAKMMFDLALEVDRRLGIKVDFVNISGGVGIPYKPEETAVDLRCRSDGIRAAYERMIASTRLHPLALCMELGRAITGPHGYLVARVLHIKDTYKKHVGLDASMAHLMRPAIYGAYHHITVVGREGQPLDHTYDVTGSLCESRDLKGQSGLKRIVAGREGDNHHAQLFGNHRHRRAGSQTAEHRLSARQACWERTCRM
jgi:diaminopimelate decarboxylase